MALRAGIVGLPNVGKTTLFNALTKLSSPASNYPFTTTESEVGMVHVPDPRLDYLQEHYKPKKTIPTTYEFIDVAGLVKGSAQGEGLGNQFLSNIREVDAIVHVVRCFDDENVFHVDDTINPGRDIETINLELILADLEIIDRRLPKIEKKALVQKDHNLKEYLVLKKLKDALSQFEPARSVELDEVELKLIRNFNFLTIKPVLYIANMDDNGITDYENHPYYQEVKSLADRDGARVIPICAEIEAELNTLSIAEKLEFMNELGIQQSGIGELILETYDLLGLATFFTASEKEVRAWTFKLGMRAPECAGVIHSDFERGFIRAETVAFDDFKAAGSLSAAKLVNKVRLEGKDYVAHDGDIMHFRFNV